MDGSSFAVCIWIAEFQCFVGCPFAGLKQSNAEDWCRVSWLISSITDKLRRRVLRCGP